MSSIYGINPGTTVGSRPLTNPSLLLGAPAVPENVQRVVMPVDSPRDSLFPYDLNGAISHAAPLEVILSGVALQVIVNPSTPMSVPLFIRFNTPNAAAIPFWQGMGVVGRRFNRLYISNDSNGSPLAVYLWAIDSNAFYNVGQ